MKERKKNVQCFRFKRWTRCKYAAFASMKRYVCIGVLSLSCSILKLKAQPNIYHGFSTSDTALEVLQKDSVDLIELQEVAIVGSRVSALNSTIKISSKLSFRDIKQAGVQDITEALKFLQTADLRGRGSKNVQGDLCIRGGTFDQSAVLLDGLNLTDPQTGHHSLNLPIPFLALSSIEVYNGFGAWNYGASPFTAAVNFKLKDIFENSLTLGLTAGMYGYKQMEAGGSFSYKNFAIGANLEHTTSDGYRENTDFSIDNVLFRAAYSSAKFGSLKFTAGYQAKEFGAYSFYSAKYREQWEATKAFFSSLQYSKVFSSRVSLELRAAYRQHLDEFALFRYKETAPDWYTGSNFHRNDLFLLGGNLNFNSGKYGLSTLGVDYRYEHIFSNNIGVDMGYTKAVSGSGAASGVGASGVSAGAVYTKAAAKNVGNVFFQHTLEREKWLVSAGVMLSLAESGARAGASAGSAAVSASSGAAGSAVSGGSASAAASGMAAELGDTDGSKASAQTGFRPRVFGGLMGEYRFTNVWKTNLSLNHAYRMPTFTDLYYSSATQKGSLNLRPEQSISVEYSNTVEKNGHRASLSPFYRYSFRVIDWVRYEGSEIFVAENINNLNTIGLDVAYEYRPQKSIIERLAFNYTYIYVANSLGRAKNGRAEISSAENGAKNFVSLYVTDYLRNRFSFSFSHKIYKPLGISYEVLVNDRRGDYKPYVICNLRLYCDILRRGEAFIGLDNIFNTKYVDIGEVEQAGFWLKAGLRFRCL